MINIINPYRKTRQLFDSRKGVKEETDWSDGEKQNNIFQKVLKDATLHDEGEIWVFQKNCIFFFPTHEEKMVDFEK